MKVFIVERKDMNLSEEYDCFTVIAENEQEARELALSGIDYGDWIVKPVNLETKGVICCSFSAG